MEHCSLYYPVAMEPPGGLPPDRDRQLVLHSQQPNINITTTATSAQSNSSLLGISAGGQQTLERLSRPMAFDKMEALVREMQDPEHGVPVRQQKMFLTSIPYAFMGYDLIEWLMDRLSIEESEALNIGNQLCFHGYFFPVNDTKSLVVKDDSSLYRFQTPYYWPWQHKAPDNVEYAIYLAKRSLRNKQRHGLEDYESEALASLHKNLKGKWDFISMQAEEQVKLAKERKKGDKIVGDSQERAYWRVHRPPPGQFTPLEPCPVPLRDRQGIKPKKKTAEDWQRDVDYLQKSLNRTRMKMSQACESLVNYSETFSEYDFFLQPVLPSNPWVTEDTTFWQLNNSIVDIPTEKRVKRWAISIEELVSDPTGLAEFTTFLEKEYSHENIRFWIAVNKLRRSAHSQVARKVNEIYEEFLKPGAPCEINIDGKTMEVVQKGLKSPSRFTFDAAAEHIYMLLLKKDCYPRFVRSEHYKNLVATGIQPSHKKRFFNFGGVGVKKKSAAANVPTQSNLGASNMGGGGPPPPGHLARRRGSDRSLTGSAHELAVIGVKDASNKVPHSHSQSNLSEMPYGETVYRGDMPTQSLAMDVTHNDDSISEMTDIACFLKPIQMHRDAPKPTCARLETTVESSSVCPWETPDSPPAESVSVSVSVSVCPWEDDQPPPVKNPLPVVVPNNPPLTPGIPPEPPVTMEDKSESFSSEITEVSDRMRRSCGLRQNTVDSEYSSKRLMPNITEQRRSSMTITPRISEYQVGPQSNTNATPSPTLLGQVEDTTFPPLFTKKLNSSAQDESNSNPIPIAEQTSKLTPNAIATDADATTTTTTISDNDNRDANVSSNASCSNINVKNSEIPSDDAKCEDVPSENVKNNKISENTSGETAAADSVHNEVANSEREGEPEVPGAADENQPELDIELDVEVEKSIADDVMSIEDEPLPPPPEELSPTTEEYQEGPEFTHQTDAYDYDIVDVDTTISPGCVAPAPTPAPSMAPLAEIEMDAVDDEMECSTGDLKLESSTSGQVKPEGDETKKKRKKRGSDAKKTDEKVDGVGSDVASKPDVAGRNTVCPWEDEDVTTSDATFVKTYATLGYL